MTYPQFMTDHNGRLVFTYRHGGSGNGINIYNRYDTATRSWSRLMDQPLFDGEGLRNAYPSKPVLGPDDMFHVTWVWRDIPDCATNQHLSYVRSRDLVRWESAAGDEIELPIRFRHKDYGSGRLLVDEETLHPAGSMAGAGNELPRELRRLQSGFPGMAIQRSASVGCGGNPGVRYLLQWESLGSNRDRKPGQPLPPPSVLKLHKLVAAGME